MTHVTATFPGYDDHSGSSGSLSVAGDGYVAIVARSTSATSFYRLALTGGNRVRLESVKSGTATVLGEASLTVAGGTAYTLGLTVSGNTLSGSVDGAPVVIATASTFAKGRIGQQPVITQTGAFTTPPYSFPLAPTADVTAQVKAGAGVGKI